jgi:ribosomal protein S18 acetylase RimI-like enzyme
MHLSRMQPEQLNEVAAFIARLQAEPTHHVAYFGERADEIAQYIRELEPAGSDGFVLAYQDEKLVGLLGVEADPEVKRAWLHGPMVDHPDWDATADQLYQTACQEVIPDYAAMHELVGDIANVHLRSFAERHGFTPLPDSAAILRFRRHKLAALPRAEAPELEPRHYDGFVRLHEATFPNTYYSGKQVIERLNAHNKVFIVSDGAVVQGYIYARVITGSEGFIDFLGVEKSARRRGMGRRLITAATRWLLSFPAVQEVALTVYSGNSAAIALYTQLGYEHLHTVQAYRKAVLANS